jgi:hypothetical protein
MVVRVETEGLEICYNVVANDGRGNGPLIGNDCHDHIDPGTSVMITYKPNRRIANRIVACRLLIAPVASLWALNTAALAEQLIPLAIERPPTQTIVLTQGFSTPIRSGHPFGKISITNPDVVDLVVRTDKSAVLIPRQAGATNIDFVDEKGVEIGNLNIIVNQPDATGRVLVFDQSSLRSATAYHCEPTACQPYAGAVPNGPPSAPITNEGRSGVDIRTQ